jgi:GGDEF domain-containing protein
MEFAQYTIYAPEQELWKPFLNALLKKGVFVDFWQIDQSADKQILIPELYLSSFPVRNANFYLLAETFPTEQMLADSRIEDVLMLSQGIDWIAYFLKKEARKRNDSEDLSLWKNIFQNINGGVIAFENSGKVKWSGGKSLQYVPNHMQMFLYGNTNLESWKSSQFAARIKMGKVFNNPNALIFPQPNFSVAAKYWVYPSAQGGLMRMELLAKPQAFLGAKDDCTHFKNRKQFFLDGKVMLRKVKKEHSQFSICQIRLPQLKSFNLEYGYDVGDQILYSLAHRLEKFHPEIQWYRLGSASFVGLSSQCLDQTNVSESISGSMYCKDDLLNIICNYSWGQYPADGLSLQQLLFHLERRLDTFNLGA